MLSRRKVLIIAGTVALGLGLGIFALLENKEQKQNGIDLLDGENSIAPENFEASSGWTVTSYQDVDEAVYAGGKEEVFTAKGISLGFYKADFLEQVKIDGSGKGDGVRNSGKFLHYDYEADNGTYYLADKSLGAYENELVPWTGDKPSIAVNPPLPKGTQVRFKNLGPDAKNNPGWVNGLLLNTTFYADDKFFGVPQSEKRIDVYVGLQKAKDSDGNPESLLMRNVAVYVGRG